MLVIVERLAYPVSSLWTVESNRDQRFRRTRYQAFELTEAGPVAVSEKIEPLQDLFACPKSAPERWG